MKLCATLSADPVLFDLLKQEANKNEVAKKMMRDGSIFSMHKYRNKPMDFYGNFHWRAKPFSPSLLFPPTIDFAFRSVSTATGVIPDTYGCYLLTSKPLKIRFSKRRIYLVVKTDEQRYFFLYPRIIFYKAPEIFFRSEKILCDSINIIFNPR